ncbi:MAG: 3-dehydroquinate synthase [Lachnospiraceae bacterium]
MEKVTVPTGKKYEVILKRGIVQEAGKYIKTVLSPGKICLVTDSVVEKLYASQVVASLEQEGFQTISYVFPKGENAKKIDTVKAILELMADHNFTRSDSIVALGGGIAGDIAGFAASIFLRGIPYVQIPTTFLAAVDSSVGGKTGVNLEGGKNLAGAFWQPSLVLCDCDTMKTLPYTIFLDGVAEVIKYGAIQDLELLEQMEQYGEALYGTTHQGDILEKIVLRCITIKAEIVGLDQRDTGKRQLLNFGHTIGHAIEKCSNYQVTHGHAVAIGMYIVSRASYQLGYSQEDCSEDLKRILLKFKFPLECNFSSKQLAEVAWKDKKRQGDRITLVVPKKMGACYLKELPISELEHFIEHAF